jgi:Uma2 family endonuclease
MSSNTPYKMTLEEYRAFEETSEIRHEFHNGIVWEVDDPRRFPPRVPVRTATVAEYLTGEHSSNRRHEYLHGDVFLMSEPSPQHELVLGKVAMLVSAQLKGTCFQSYVRPRVAVGSTFITYPDMAIFDGEPSNHPLVIIDVLDAGNPEDECYITRLDYHATVESFREYLTVYSNQALVTQRVRGDDGGWWLRDHRGLDATLRLATAPVSLNLSDVFQS